VHTGFKSPSSKKLKIKQRGKSENREAQENPLHDEGDEGAINPEDMGRKKLIVSKKASHFIKIGPDKEQCSEALREERRFPSPLQRPLHQIVHFPSYFILSLA
jgi:hypothetical protein